MCIATNHCRGMEGGRGGRGGEGGMEGGREMEGKKVNTLRPSVSER